MQQNCIKKYLKNQNIKKKIQNNTKQAVGRKANQKNQNQNHKNILQKF